jgi:hypothetical protein
MSEGSTIIEALIEKIKNDRAISGKDLTTSLREICDKVYEEESAKFTKEEKDLYTMKLAPRGPNILLCLPVPGRTQNEIGFLTLERDFFTEPKISSDPEFFIVFWVTNKSSEIKPLKKIKVIKVGEYNPLKIISFYAKTISYCRGE